MVNATPLQEPATKRGPHRWPKGVSGNPHGRAKHVLPDGRSVREAARAATPEALELLLEAMRDREQPMPLRVQAAQALLRTGHADAVKDTPDIAGMTFVVQQIAVQAVPVPGVLNSPVREHISLLPLAHSITGRGTVVEMEGPAQCA